MHTWAAFWAPASNIFPLFPRLISRDITNPSLKESIAGLVTWIDHKIGQSIHTLQKLASHTSGNVLEKCTKAPKLLKEYDRLYSHAI
jgi:hypothetical protein